MNKKKILFVTWSLTQGGGEARSVTNILNNLSKDKYEIDVFELNRGTKELYVNSNIRFLTPIVDHRRNDTIAQKIKLNRIMKDPICIKTLINKEYDCVIACNRGGTSYISSYIPSLKKIVWIRGSVNNHDSNNYQDKFLKRIVEKQRRKQDEVFDKYDKIVVVSDSLFESFNKIFYRQQYKVEKIYNSINPDEVREKAREKKDIDIKTTTNCICSVGRLREVKNHKLLIDAIKILVDKKVDVNLLIIGEGRLKKELQKYIDEKNLNNYIKLVGYYSNPFPILSMCNIFCLSSLSEGFNLSMSEACALGIPFVSTDVGGASEILNVAECGVISNNNAEEYASKIYELIENKQLYERLKENCKIASSFFSTKALGEKVEHLIDNLFEEGGDYHEEE